ncbi:TetR/AcrR family transcriptional regulator [Rhodococcus sp. NPDC003322]
MTRPGASLPRLFERAIGHAGSPEPSELEDVAVYDAALGVLAEQGTRAATMDDVAARSGISRATLFRRFGGKDSLFEAAVAHALRAFLDRITDTFTSVTDPTERIAEAFLACLRLRRRFVVRGVDRGGELLAMLSTGTPSALEIGHRFIAARIVAAQQEGRLPGGDANLRAEAVIRVTLGYLLVPSAHLDLDDDAAARDLARRVIAPLVTGAMP